MDVFFNGRFVPEEAAAISVHDRGFLYGDGLFESVLVWNGRPFRWSQHWRRLEEGASVLRFSLPCSGASLEQAVEQWPGAPAGWRGMVRLSVTRGPGPRGYSPRGAGPGTFVMTRHPWPGPGRPELASWSLATVSLRVPSGEPLTRIKSANKLVQVLARMEAESQEADEGLLLNAQGRVAEAASANLFWIKEGRIGTPPLSDGALGGITRAVLLETAAQRGWPAEEVSVTPQALRGAEGIGLTLSSQGVVEVNRWDGRPVPRSPRVGELFRAYWELVERECPAA